jgi:hypothetical protein
MADHVIQLRLTDLTDDDIDHIEAAAAALGATVVERGTVMGADLPVYVTVALGVMSPFLTEAAKQTMPQFVELVRRTFRRQQAMQIIDADVYLLWDKVAMANLRTAVNAINAIDLKNLPPKTVLVFDDSTLQWRPDHP